MHDREAFNVFMAHCGRANGSALEAMAADMGMELDAAPAPVGEVEAW